MKSDGSRERWVVGAMTGTSLDGLDAALVRITGQGLAMQAEHVQHVSLSLDGLREDLAALASGEAHEPIAYLRAARALGERYADTVTELQRDHAVDFAVCHGQTIWHAPGSEGGGVSWQLFDPWPIVKRCGVPVCYDLRQADLIAGGQGAPITPIADRVLFGGPGRTCVVNLGGIANVTWLEGERFGGQDVCPCNLLIDGVVQRALPGQAYDQDGEFSAGPWDPEAVDTVVHAMQAVAEGHLTLGREQASASWLEGLMAGLTVQGEAAVSAAVRAVAGFLSAHLAERRPERVVLAGGGAYNRTLVSAIREGLPEVSVLTSAELGLPVEAREAVCFAVLGALSQDGVPITPTPSAGRAGAWVYP